MKKWTVAPDGESNAQLKEVLWPIAEDYESPIVPIFLNQFQNLKDLDENSTWLARDGLIPLLWFFERFPRPLKGFKGRIYVAEEWSGWIPPAWRPRFGSYRLVSQTSPLGRSLHDQLLITGLVMEPFTSLSFLDKCLSQVTKRFAPKQLAKMKKVAFLPCRPHPFAHECNQSYHSKFILRMAQVLGADIDVMNWHQFDWQDSCYQTYVVDLNEKLLCSDNYLVHHTMTRGATLLDMGRQSPADEIVALSPHHGFALNHKLKSATQGKEVFKGRRAHQIKRYVLEIEEAVDARYRGPFPWPRSFEGWCRSLHRD